MSRKTKSLSISTKVRRDVLTVVCKNKYAALYPEMEEKQRDRLFHYVKERPHLHTPKVTTTSVVETLVKSTKTSLMHKVPKKTRNFLKAKSELQSKILFGTATLSIERLNADCTVDNYRRALLQSILYIEKRSSHFNNDWNYIKKALGLYRLGKSDRYLITRVPTWKSVRSRAVKILDRRPFRCKTYLGRSFRSLYKSFIKGEFDRDKNLLSYFYGIRTQSESEPFEYEGSADDHLRLVALLQREARDRSDDTARVNGWYHQLGGMLSFY